MESRFYHAHKYFGSIRSKTEEDDSCSFRYVASQSEEKLTKVTTLLRSVRHLSEGLSMN